MLNEESKKIIGEFLEKKIQESLKTPSKFLAVLVGAGVAGAIIHNTKEGKPLHDAAKQFDDLFKKDDTTN